MSDSPIIEDGGAAPEPGPEKGSRGSGRTGLVLPPVAPNRYSESRIARWGKIGCIGGLVLAAVALFASFLLLQRGMMMLGQRAISQIEAGLPEDLDQAERERIEESLGKLRVVLRHDADADAILSRFLGVAAPALEDGALTADEVAEISREIDRALDPAGWIVEPTPSEEVPARLRTSEADDRSPGAGR